MAADVVNGQQVERPDKTAAARQLVAAVDQFSGMLERIPDGTVPATGTWSVRDVAVHVGDGLPFYSRMLTGGGSPARTLEDIPSITEELLRANPETDLKALAGSARANAAEFCDAALAIDGDPEVPYHFGLTWPVSCLLGVMVGEAIVHGYDLARLAGARWRIPDEWAHTAFRSIAPAVPLLLDTDAAAGVRSTYDIRMRGVGGPRVVVRIADGSLTVHQPGSGGRVDCYLSGDPLSLLLVLYGRKGAVGQALRGKAVAWGRKPWRGLVMTKYVRNI